MDDVAAFRKLLGVVDPAQLTVADRLALLDLVQAAFDSTNSGGGGASNAIGA